MSFGMRDADWVDPPESQHMCGTCRRFNICPCGRHEWGWCTEVDSWVESTDEACDGWEDDEW